MIHPDSPEFLAILERVPRWHMLTPGEWRTGDYYWDHHRKVWDGINGPDEDHPDDGFLNPDSFTITAKEIPEHVRRSEAWWALYNQLATVAPDKRGWLMGHDKRIPERTETPDALEVFASVFTVNYGLPKFIDDLECHYAVDILGGYSEIIKNLQEGPGAYMRWVLTQGE